MSNYVFWCEKETKNDMVLLEEHKIIIGQSDVMTINSYSLLPFVIAENILFGFLNLFWLFPFKLSQKSNWLGQHGYGSRIASEIWVWIGHC